MALYERLLGYTATGGSLPGDQAGISQHAFAAMLAERARGLVTNAQIIAAFALTPSEQTEVSALVSRFTTGPTGDRLTREQFEDVSYIGRARLAPYDTIAAVRARLGV